MAPGVAMERGGGEGTTAARSSAAAGLAFRSRLESCMTIDNRSLNRCGLALTGYMGCWTNGLRERFSVLTVLYPQYRLFRSIQFTTAKQRNHHISFCFPLIETVVRTEFIGFGQFGFGSGLFGSVYRSSVYMPTPTSWSPIQKWLSARST